MRKIIKKRFCKNGHDINVVGRTSYRMCRACRRDWEMARYIPHPRKPVQFCPQGHDTFVTGRDNKGMCKQCLRDNQRIDPTKDSRIKDICPKGHDKRIVGRLKKGICAECKRISGKNYHNKNKERISKRNKKRYKNNTEQYKQWSLKRLYGLTLDDYNFLLEKQKGRCAICRSTYVGRKGSVYFYLDHDHKTGKIRGLLCNFCNCMIGFSKDSIKNLKAAIKYLKKQNTAKIKIRRIK